MTKRLGLLICMALIAITLYNCRKDVTILPPPSLVGTYTGTYAREVQQQPDSEKINQHVTWTFTTTKFYMDYDQAYYAHKEDAKVCDCGGIYAVASGIDLESETSQDSNRTKRSCTTGYSPDGQYQLDQSVANEVTMTGVSYNTAGMKILRTIHLVKTSS
jgi:hypothetical protein